MGFLGDIERALGVWYKDPDDSPDDTNPQVALAFRNYVINRLGDGFVCKEREDRVLGEPDLEIFRKSDSTSFDVVTCYRSRMFVGEDGEAYLPWTEEETYEKLLNYADSHKNQCYVIIGLHGFADVPKFVFVLPLSDAVIDLKKSVLAKFEKGKSEKLF